MGQDQPKNRRHKRQLSTAELAQRRSAAPAATAASMGKHTGPITEDGKAASSRNAWKHGGYSAINRAQFQMGAASLAHAFGKPCLTTCPLHPDNPERTEAPCGLVLDGITRAGASCLDRTVYANAITAIMGAIADGDMDGMNGLLATELAAAVQQLHQMREAISNFGMICGAPVIDKKGRPVIDPDTGKPYMSDLKANPVIPHLIRLTESLGISFAEVLATPQSRQRARTEEETGDGLAKLMGAIMQRAQNGRAPRRPAIEGG